MNILFISNSSELYGANLSLLDILSELKYLNYKIVVIVMKRSKWIRELKNLNVKTYEIDYTTNSSLGLDLGEKIIKLHKNLNAVLQLKKIIKMEKIDIIHTNASNIDIGAMASIMYRIPHVWHIREMLYEDYGMRYDFPILTKILLHFAARKIVISDYVKENRKLGKNTIVIHDGINIEKYNIERKNYFINKKLRVLYCGVISKQKGIMDIIRAVNYLIKNNYRDIELYIAGDLNPYAKKIQNYVKSNNLEEYIFFCGYQKDLYEIRMKSDVAIMSSRSEALGRVTIEGMLSNLLVIGADAGATSEIIKNGVTGILYTSGDIRQLAQTLINIKKNKDKNVKIIKNGKKYALKNFDKKKYVHNLIDIYKEIV